MAISVIIATNNRPEALKKALDSLLVQTLLPDEVIIVHAGEDIFTKPLCEQTKYGLLNLRYFNSGPLGAAKQRNIGAERASGDILFFLDDDVMCKPDFIKEIMEVFSKDSTNEIGGVSGIGVNQIYTPLSRINRLLFELSLKRKERCDNYSGRVVGPAVNFLPMDKADAEQQVDWLLTTCCAYRKDIFLEYRFNEDFRGYSFMEDVELSCRLGKKFKLINTTKARCFHKDLGGKTHKDWAAIGKMQVLNRWHVMTEVLDKKTLEDKCRFFYYQVYCLMAELKLLFKWPDVKNTLLRWYGRLLGMWNILTNVKIVMKDT